MQPRYPGAGGFFRIMCGSATVLITIALWLICLCMISYGKPVSTFPDHASGDSGIETALELGEKLQDLIVGERQKLRHDRAGHALVRIKPEVGVE